MADAAPAAARPLSATGRRVARVLSGLVLVVVALAVLLFAGIRWLDTEGGRGFLTSQLYRIAPQSGLRVAVGRIDGSIYARATLHDVALSDSAGVFARVPRLDLDWTPRDLLGKRFTARALTAPEVRLLRRPALNPSTDDRILPDFDFDIGRLAVDRLILSPGVAGPVERRLGLAGRVLIAAGRAQVRAAALALPVPGQRGAGDAVRLTLDAQPDRNIFDVDATVTAPADGAIAALAGLQAPLAVRLAGDGSWRQWQGRLDARLGDGVLAGLAVSNTQGRFHVTGDTAPALLLARGSALAPLLTPGVSVAATAVMDRDDTDLDVALASRMLRVTARGTIDIDAETIAGLTVAARLADPRALYPRLNGTPVALDARVGGTFARPTADWRLVTARLAWGGTAAEGLAASGVVRVGDGPLTIPVSATARRLAGLPASVAPLATNVRLDGPLVWRGGRLQSTALRLRTDRASATGTLLLVPATGSWLVTAKAALPKFALAGLGSADVTADVRIVPDPAGARVTGRATVLARRLENDGILAVTGGLPRLTSDFDVAGNLVTVARNIRLVSPGLGFTGSARYSPDGRIQLTGTAVSRDYGRVALTVAGPLTAPQIDLVAARPGLGLGLADVRARVTPVAAGWRFVVTGQSSYGPVAADGVVRSGAGPLAIDLANASVAGIEGRGSIVRTPAGPFAGTLRFAGQGLTGTAVLAAAGAVQRADITADAREAVLTLATPVGIEAGTIRATVLLPEGGPSATGSFDLKGVTRGGLTIDDLDGQLRYADGRGSARATLSGSSGTPFRLTTAADFAPDRITVTADGSIDQRPVRLSGPAVLTRGAEGWSLAPVSVVTADGSAELSGLLGGAHQRLRARFDRVSLALLSLAAPTLDLAGRISGTLDIDVAPGTAPVGTASLRLNGLSRAGIASSSLPIDVGVNARLAPQGSAMRAVIVRGGRVEGRAQAQLGAIPAGDEPLIERVFAARVTGQLRYNGPAQALWGLSGVSALDVRGPVAVAADVGGVLGDPQVAGTIRAAGARVEAPLLGAVVDQASLDARFTASRLELTRFAGRAGSGTVSGSGGIDLAFDRSFPMDIRVQLQDAAVLKRDDVTATADGNIRIATDEFGGVLSGRLAIDRATYRVGTTAAVEVPVLPVIERNTRVLGRRASTYVAPTRWLLNLAIKGDRRLFVEGMGITSEWQADLRVRGAVTAPEAVGRVQLVRGDYDFAGKRFQLTRGDLRFQGVYPPDPVINIAAETTANGFTAQLAIDGTAQRPNIRFSSVPALPEDEVLSRVLFGTSVTNLSAPEAVQLAAALASLRGGGGGFNPVGAVKKGLGIDRLRILPADTALGRKTAVAAGQYIGRSVYVELATDAQGYTATSIEIGLTRSLSVLSQVATLGGTSANLRWKRDY